MSALEDWRGSAELSPSALTNAGGRGLISNYRNGDVKKITRQHIEKVKNLTKGTFGFNQPIAADSCHERLY